MDRAHSLLTKIDLIYLLIRRRFQDRSFGVSQEPNKSLVYKTRKQYTVRNPMGRPYFISATTDSRI